MRIIGRLGLLTALSAASIAGCGPAVPREDLGQVEYQVPKVAGADEPYKLPNGGAKANPSNEGNTAKLVPSK